MAHKRYEIKGKEEIPSLQDKGHICYWAHLTNLYQFRVYHINNTTVIENKISSNGHNLTTLIIAGNNNRIDETEPQIEKELGQELKEVNLGTRTINIEN